MFKALALAALFVVPALITVGAPKKAEAWCEGTGEAHCFTYVRCTGTFEWQCSPYECWEACSEYEDVEYCY